MLNPNFVLKTFLTTVLSGGVSEVLSEPTTRPYTQLEIKDHDAFLSAQTAGYVYENGADQICVQPLQSKNTVDLPASKLMLSVENFTDMTVQRYFVSSNAFVAKESVFGKNRDVRVTVSISPSKPGLKIIDRVFETGRELPSVDRAWMAEIGKAHASDLEVFEYLASLKRNVILNMPWPESAKHLAMWETYIRSIMLASEKLTRYDCGSITLFLCERKQSDGSKTICSGPIFNNSNKSWLGDIWFTISHAKGDDHSRVIELISRLKASN